MGDKTKFSSMLTHRAERPDRKLTGRRRAKSTRLLIEFCAGVSQISQPADKTMEFYSKRGFRKGHGGGQIKPEVKLFPFTAKVSDFCEHILSPTGDTEALK